MIERDLHNKGKLTQAQIAEIVRRHKLRDISFYSPSWVRRAKVRWRLYNLEEGY